jgi:O-antigen/teichoic acid export membrane protein
VRLIAASVLIGVPSMITEPALGALNKMVLLPLFRTLALIVMFVALALCVRFGPIGAAASQLVTSALLISLNLALQARFAGINPSRYVRPLAGVALNCLAMVAVLTLVAAGDAQCHMPPWLDVALRVLAGASSYSLGLAVLNRARVSVFIATLKGGLAPAR